MNTEQAELRRDTALNTHADNNGDWIETAALRIRQHAQSGEPFLIEQVKQHWDGPEPRDPRAWGAATRRAKAAGWIRMVGYAAANSSNRGAKCQWMGVP